VQSELALVIHVDLNGLLNERLECWRHDGVMISRVDTGLTF
jgi:hypothetical protein